MTLALHGRWSDAADTLSTYSSARNQARAFQNTEVFRYGWKAARERSRELGDGRLAEAKALQDRSPGRVRQRTEHLIKLCGVIVNHMVIC